MKLEEKVKDSNAKLVLTIQLYALFFFLRYITILTFFLNIFSEYFVTYVFGLCFHNKYCSQNFLP